MNAPTDALEDLRKIYRSAKVVCSGKYLTTVNEFADQIPALRPDVLWNIAKLACDKLNTPATKLLVEEDKGGPIGTAVSLRSGLPLSMARFYPYETGSEFVESVSSEYIGGKLHINGLEKCDKIVIVEDTISTGGTIVAMVNAIKKIGAEVVQVIAVVEKVQNGGVAKVLEETGIRVETLLKIEIKGMNVNVLN